MLPRFIQDGPEEEEQPSDPLAELLALLPPDVVYDCASGQHEPQPIKAAGKVLGYLCARCRAKCDAAGLPPDHVLTRLPPTG